MSAQRPRRPSRSGDSTNPKSPITRGELDRLASSSSANDSSESTSPWTATSAPPPRPPSTSVAQSPAQPYFKVPASPRSAPSNTEASTAKQAKIAIPRLKRPHDGQDGSSKPGGRHRVTHACEPCRHRKTKCSGERPACRHCQDFKIQCYYADGKRDRVKKQFGSMTEKVADYEKLLRELMNRASLDDTVLIKSVLERAAQHDMDENMTEASTVQSIEPDGDTELSGAESEVSAGVGSTGALDRTDEDFTRDGVKMTGFMGKNSEVTWLQRVRQEIKSDPPEDPHADRAKRIPGSFNSPQQRSDTNMPGYEAEEDLTIQDSSYHLNDLAIVAYDAVDMYEIPPAELAQTMFDTYMRRVHPSFPIVGRINLINQFTKFIQKPASRPPPKWLAILNLIFAISARYSHLIQASWRGDDRDHLIYFTRARLLAIDNETLFNHPDLQMIQILALMSFYLMATDQINRAWRLIGVAIRDATGLGLNMRNDSTELSNALKEIRYRVWWALYCLESRLCSMTGRVNCVNDEHCTAPLPVPMLEDEFETEQGKRLLSQEQQQSDRAPASNMHTPSVDDGSKSSSDRSRSGSKKDASKSPGGAQPQAELDWARDANPSTALFFLHFVQLCRLSQQIFNGLYNPQSLHGSWSDIQHQMQQLQVQADHWYKQLPTAFDFKRTQRERENAEGRMALGFYYYGVIQILNRPCLCRLDRKVPNQSQKSSEFNHNAAMMCVNAACDQLALIPEEPNAIGLLGQGPWANLLNLLVQSASVLMLEISFRAHHMPERVDDLIESAKKSVRWLHALGAENLAAARAWKLCDQMLHDAVGKVGRRITGMPTNPPKSMAPGFGDRIPQPAQSGQQPTRPQMQQQFSQGSFHNQMFVPQPSVPQDFGGYTMPSQSYMGQFGSTQFDQYSMMDPGMMEFQFQEQDMGLNMNMEFSGNYHQSPDNQQNQGDNNSNNNRSGGQSFG